MNFENYEEAGSSGVMVNEKIEMDETAGIQIICFCIYNAEFVILYIGQVVDSHKTPS